MEILAPAGGMDSLYAAVYCGADAAYFGLGSFNARRGAQNFDGPALSGAVRLCRQYGVKTYLTLNTLAFDGELRPATDCLRAACDAGVSAVIVQDAGLMRLARSCAPGLPLYASTQMSVHNLAGVMELAEMGFSRVVLARELSLAEIRAICAASPIEVEVFCHGALCVCVSGQCTLSAMIGGRSGNRGLCAQPCRLPMRPGRDGRALSLRDLSLLTPDAMRALERAGVASVKIEGRMKRPEYVAAAVTAARQARDGRMPDRQLLQDIFSRGGFTDGYFRGDIGEAMFGVRTKEDARAAANALAPLQRLYRKPVGRVPLHMTLEVRPGVPARLSASDGMGCTAESSGPIPQPAGRRPLTDGEVRRQLEKLGGTCFVPGEIRAGIGEGLFIPSGALNAMRRDAAGQVAALRARARPIPFLDAPIHLKERSPRGGGFPAFRAALESAGQFTPALAESCELIALYPRELERLFAQGGAEPYLDRIALRQPPVDFDESALVRALRAARMRGVRRLLVSGLSGIRIGKREGFVLHGDFSLNAANSLALEEYADRGLEDITVSFELSAARIRRLKGALPRGVAGYGRLPLMTMRCCPLRGAVGCARCRAGAGILTDRRGERFPVSCLSGAAQLYNSHVLELGDRIPEFGGIDFIWFYFGKEDCGRETDLLRRYREGKGAASMEGRTRGLYFRKVQ